MQKTPNQLLAYALRKERERMKLSIDQVAARIGCKPADVTRWEAGRGPRFGSAVKWAGALGLEVKLDKARGQAT